MLNTNNEELTPLMTNEGEFFGDEDELEENVDPEVEEGEDRLEDDSYMFD